MIELRDLKNGVLYKLRSRNLRQGVYRENSQGFVGIREKFGNRFLDHESEYTTSEHFGTATALEEVCECPIADLRETLDTECGECGAAMEYVYWTEETRPKGNTFPGQWTHLDKPDCGKLEPMAVSNRALFDWLDSKDRWLN